MKFINDRRRMQGQSGFTLIELLVVIAILGILAGVVVFSVSGIGDKGQTSACKIGERTINTAAEAFQAQNAFYPKSAADKGPAATDKPFIGGFLDEAPNADDWVIVYDPSGSNAPALTAGSNCT